MRLTPAHRSLPTGGTNTTKCITDHANAMTGVATRLLDIVTSRSSRDPKGARRTLGFYAFFTANFASVRSRFDYTRLCFAASRWRRRYSIRSDDPGPVQPELVTVNARADDGGTPMHFAAVV